MPSKTKFKANSVLTPTGMLMFNHLTQPSPRFPGGDPCFNFVLLMDDEKALGKNASPEWRAMRAAIAEAIDFEFGVGKSQDAEFVKTLKLPIKPAIEKKQYTGFVAGKCFINPWTKEKPGIVDVWGKDVLDTKAVFTGQLIRGTVVFFPYDFSSSSRGVGVMVNNVQIMKADMPRMDGRKPASQDFPAGAGADQGADAGADGDQESPF
jgi:hypothetical protein